MKKYFNLKGMMVFGIAMLLGLLAFTGFVWFFKEPASAKPSFRLDEVTRKELVKTAKRSIEEQVVLTNDDWKMSVERIQILDAKGWKMALRVCYTETERSEKFHTISTNMKCSVENLPEGATVNDLFAYTERATENVAHILTE
jgi:hypothetical protein